MIVSHNELVSTVEKAFLGARRVCGEADVIAAMVADLQMFGLDGIRHFNNANRRNSWGTDRAVTVTNHDECCLNINLHSSSVACHFPTVLDFAIDKMAVNKSISITLQRCHNPWFIHGELLKLAEKGKACRAVWTDYSEPRQVTYILNSGKIAPEIWYSHSSNLSTNLGGTVEIELSTNDFDIPRYTPEYTRHISSDKLLFTKEIAWRDGVFVEDEEWEQLKRQATLYLVEKSEHSARGAGESVVS
ncbi:DUF3726 domain-containing protein [Vibrio pectenicida]|uniref:DUF3726 domain-containing protein n=1 Tax=Vibrio pectenicida TaxID=62763 RepID=A0A7Y3ZYQ6_9VIBR|nr:DUF3726 domain-containing protein [Vibrio pectenicida]NOH71311.1 DUF3726 domain-containing protein [Vibrio pectenicida]